MRLSRSMVATLAVLGVTCALPALAASEAATAPPKAGPYIDAKSAVNLRVAKDRKTISSLDASCFVHHVQQGTWELRRLKLSHGMFAYQGPIKVRFESGVKTLPVHDPRQVRARSLPRLGDHQLAIALRGAAVQRQAPDASGLLRGANGGTARPLRVVPSPRLRRLPPASSAALPRALAAYDIRRASTPLARLLGLAGLPRAPAAAPACCSPAPARSTRSGCASRSTSSGSTRAAASCASTAPSRRARAAAACQVAPRAVVERPDRGCGRGDP